MKGITMKTMLAVLALSVFALAADRIANVDYVTPSVVSITCASGHPVAAGGTKENVIVTCEQE